MSAPKVLPTFAERAKEYGLSLMSRRVDKRPDVDADAWDAGASHWRVTLLSKNGGGEYATYYSMGSARKGEPELDDVLSSLVLDASNAHEPFASWCAEYGYDTDSRKAERMYHACQRTREGLVRLVGLAGLDALLYNTEPL